MNSLKPLGDHIVVAPIEHPEKSAGGVFIPPEAQEKANEGFVVAVGSGRLLLSGQRVPMEVAPGDTVIYSRYAGSEVEDPDGRRVLITENDVLALRVAPKS